MTVPVTAARRFLRALTPLGARDLVLQIAVFQALGLLYAVTGIYARQEAAAAIANSRSILRVEHTLGLDWEASLQHAVLTGPGPLQSVADLTYFTCQFVVSSIFLLWVYARHTGRYPLVRDALVAANAVALIVAIVYPAAPPRLVGGAGLVDTLDSNAVNMHSSIVDALNNPYSAMPSLHTSYAVVIGVSGVLLTRRWWARMMWAVYPVVVVYSILATGNHFVLDAAGGILALAATPLAARGWRRMAGRWDDHLVLRAPASAAPSRPSR